MPTTEKIKLATVWLSGCSGCHMSILDQDERLIELAEKVQLVYSPFADIKTFPEDVDITLVEGAVANEEQEDLIKQVRAHTKTLVSLGDCAVTGNVTALRNTLGDGAKSVLQKAYVDTTDVSPQIPMDIPRLLEQAFPVHEVVRVDHCVPGCPPSAILLNYVLTELLSGKIPSMEGRAKFG